MTKNYASNILNQREIQNNDENIRCQIVVNQLQLHLNSLFVNQQQNSEKHTPRI